MSKRVVKVRKSRKNDIHIEHQIESQNEELNIDVQEIKQDTKQEITQTDIQDIEQQKEESFDEQLKKMMTVNELEIVAVQQEHPSLLKNISKPYIQHSNNDRNVPVDTSRAPKLANRC